MGLILALSILSCVSSSPGGNGQNIDELNIAIRNASDYLNKNIPGGSKIVILNIQSVSHDLSDYIIDELIANAVNDKVFTVVDRQQLDEIRSEQNFQLSGEVDDADAVAIGKFFGAQTIVSGAVNRFGTGYRIIIRALEVKTARIQGQYNRNIAASKTINSYMAGDSSITEGSSTGAITVTGNSLAEKFAWLQRNAESHKTYILVANKNENIVPHTLEYKGTINITIALRGDTENRIIRLMSNGVMFTVRPNVTFVLENNITLQGHKGNNGSMIRVEGGTLIMKSGSTITGNESPFGYGGGVSVGEGTFEMTGGIISGNESPFGGGVYVGEAFSLDNSSTFNMSGGTISGNTSGGGVSVGSGTFNMSGGTITGNTSISNGGGVSSSSNFTMTGGTISGNKARSGGGAYIVAGTFDIRGNAIITNNTATGEGGGVSFHTGHIFYFNKSGGTITGYNSDPNNGNVVRDDTGTIVRRGGHAVYINENFREENTAGPGVNLSFENE